MTIAGRHTMEETRQLIAAKDALIQQIQSAFTKSGWVGADAEDWRADWYDFNQRWIRMKKDVNYEFTKASIMSPGIPASVVPTEDEWQLVLKACNASGTGLYTDGDLPDMQHRLEKVVGPFVDGSKIPKQDGWDADLAGYKQADNATKEIKTAATSNTARNIGLGVALALGAVVAIKTI